MMRVHAWGTHCPHETHHASSLPALSWDTEKRQVLCLINICTCWSGHIVASLAAGSSNARIIWSLQLKLMASSI